MPIKQSMTYEQFLQKFANTRIDDRSIKVNDPLTLNDIYDQVSKLEDTMRPYSIKQQRLIDLAEWHWIKKEEK